MGTGTSTVYKLKQILEKLSGQYVNISGQPVTISGQPITISGQPVKISGAVVKISGEKVYVENQSGQSLFVQISGFPFSMSGNVVKISGEKVYVENQSGQALYTQISGYTHLLSGLQVIINSGIFAVLESGTTVEADISGEWVEAHILSGEVVAKISGEKIYAEQQSGQAMAVMISGYTVPISGEMVEAHILSGEVTLKSGQQVIVQQPLVVKVSGEKVYVENQSGQALDIKISGYTVPISGEWIEAHLLSGEVTLTSGQHVIVQDPLVVKVSGEKVYAEQQSGQAMTVMISGYTVPISGEMVEAHILSGEVTLRSGQQVIVQQPLPVKVSGEKVYVENQSGQALDVKISGFIVETDVSGSWVEAHILSGEVTLTSGQHVIVQDPLVVKVSGEKIYVENQSGQALYVEISGSSIDVDVSGTWVEAHILSGEITLTSGQQVIVQDPLVVKVSGEKLYVETQSGQALYTQISGYTVETDVSGNWVEAHLLSGEVTLTSGQQVIVQQPLPVKISGEKVYVENQSGQALYVEISGSSIDVDVSGNWVEVHLLSGEVTLTSGQYVIVQDPLVVKVSGEKIYAEQQSGQAMAVYISGYTVPISGEVVKISGEMVEAHILSGEVVAKISGEFVKTGRYLPVHTSGVPTIASGDVGWILTDEIGRPLVLAIPTSGAYVQISGQGVMISGQTVDITTPTSLFKRKVTVGAISGGISLWSGNVVSVTVKAPSWNSGDIFLGGSNHALGYSPYSGDGMQLEPKEALNIDIDNPNVIHAFAEVSGDEVLVIGVAN